MISPADAFLMRTGTGHSFGAVIAIHDGVPFVLFQNGARGTADPALVERGKLLLTQMATEVAPA